MRNYKILIFPLIGSMLLAVACGERIPIKEMVAAKAAITKALSVKADKYADEELEAAKTKLFASHDFIKNDDMKKAAASADESLKSAEAAYNKAVPLLAKDTIDVGEQSLAEAVSANAEQLAKTEYADAKSAMDTANSEYENKKFYEAYQQALIADSKAKTARTAAIGKKDVLKDAIDEVKLTIQKAEKYNAEKIAPENLRLAKENAEIAETSYEDLTLKKGFDAQHVAKFNADEAYLKSVKQTSETEIAASKALIEKAENSEGAEAAADELEAAKESQKNAEEKYADSRYDEAIDYAREASRLSGIVIVTKKPVIETDKGTVSAGDGIDAGDGSSKAENAEHEDYFLYTVVYRQKLKDCLWRIAGRFYKNPLKWKKIYHANKDKIKDPDLIYPGWILKVPKLK